MCFCGDDLPTMPWREDVLEAAEADARRKEELAAREAEAVAEMAKESEKKSSPEKIFEYGDVVYYTHERDNDLIPAKKEQSTIKETMRRLCGERNVI